MKTHTIPSWAVASMTGGRLSFPLTSGSFSPLGSDVYVPRADGRWDIWSVSGDLRSEGDRWTARGRRIGAVKARVCPA